jgi:hypothetical protein
VTAPRGVIRWLDADNAGPLGYLKQPGSHRYLDGQWVLELVEDGNTHRMTDLPGTQDDVQGVIRAAEDHLDVQAGQSWTPMLNGYGDAYTADLPILPGKKRTTAVVAPFVTAATMCGLIATVLLPPVFGIIGMILAGVAIGRREPRALFTFVFCVAAMLFGMAYGIYSVTGYWPWQTVYYYR